MAIIKMLLAGLAALASVTGLLFTGIGTLARIFGDGSAGLCLQSGATLLLIAGLFGTAAVMA